MKSSRGRGNSISGRSSGLGRGRGRVLGRGLHGTRNQQTRVSDRSFEVAAAAMDVEGVVEHAVSMVNDRRASFGGIEAGPAEGGERKGVRSASLSPPKPKREGGKARRVNRRSTKNKPKPPPLPLSTHKQEDDLFDETSFAALAPRPEDFVGRPFEAGHADAGGYDPVLGAIGGEAASAGLEEVGALESARWSAMPDADRAEEEALAAMRADVDAVDDELAAQMRLLAMGRRGGVSAPPPDAWVEASAEVESDDELTRTDPGAGNPGVARPAADPRSPGGVRRFRGFGRGRFDGSRGDG